MKEALWGYLILFLGIAIISFMLLVQNLTSTTEEDFYLTREVLEASMYDAIDYGTYAKSGKLVMSESKFVEVFLRRFAESVTDNKDYTINFYDIHEYPPKATVTITTATGETTIVDDTVNINAITYLNAILETNYTRNEKSATLKKDSIMFKFNEENETLTEISGDGFTKNVTLTYRFLSDNDSCGYYLETNANDNTRKMTKNPINEADKYYEYCYVLYNNEPYYVRIEDLSNITISSSTNNQ